ncbi:MAG: HAD family hydrolase [Sphaerochaetaceae bacterium]|jgi:phosphoglycolate phosphatase
MQQEKVKAVLFDLDGTLVNTIDDIVSAINKALVEEQIEGIDSSIGKSVVGNGLRNALNKTLLLRGDSVSPQRLEQLYQVLLSYYKDHPVIFSKPYEGITEMLEDLRVSNIVLGVFSNKADELVQKILSVLFPSHPFRFILGLREGLPRKPDPMGVSLFCQETGVAPKETLYVGDSEVDYQLAINSHCQVALVTWGFRSESQLRKLDEGIICDTIVQLKRRIHAV